MWPWWVGRAGLLADGRASEHSGWAPDAACTQKGMRRRQARLWVGGERRAPAAPPRHRPQVKSWAHFLQRLGPSDQNLYMGPFGLRDPTKDVDRRANFYTQPRSLYPGVGAE